MTSINLHIPQTIKTTAIHPNVKVRYVTRSLDKYIIPPKAVNPITVPIEVLFFWRASKHSRCKYMTVFINVLVVGSRWCHNPEPTRVKKVPDIFEALGKGQTQAWNRPGWSPLPRASPQSALASVSCRSADRDRLGCRSPWLARACQRSTNPDQNSLSLRLRAVVARRRHSSMRLRNNSVLTPWPPDSLPTAAPGLELTTLRSGGSVSGLAITPQYSDGISLRLFSSAMLGRIGAVEGPGGLGSSCTNLRPRSC